MNQKIAERLLQWSRRESALDEDPALLIWKDTVSGVYDFESMEDDRGMDN